MTRQRWLARCAWGSFVAVTLVGSVFLLGCISNRVTLDVDIASFLDPSDRSAHYEAPPGSVEVDYDLDPIGLTIEGYDELRQAEQVDLEIAVSLDNHTGTGDGSFRVFFSDTAESVFATPVVTQIDFELAPGVVSEGTAQVRGDARVLALFQQRQMWIGIRLHWAPQDGGALEGNYTITRLNARVISNLDLL